MQDIIKKIIEIDRMAQKMTNDALALKQEAETSIEEDKKKLRDGYLARARRRIKITEQTEQNFLKESLEEIEKKYSGIADKLNDTYQTNHQKWSEQLFNRVTGR